MAYTALQDDARDILSVTQLTTDLKHVVNDAFPSIWVRGEISNIKTYASGHAYPILKDEKSQVPCALFRGVLNSLKFELEEGMTVIAHGRMDVYPPRGSCQFIINAIEPDGIGALQLAFEQLKMKLGEEGLFDEDRKRELPFLPKRVGIVTSLHGAAVHDLYSVLKRRHPGVEILVYPVAVQGEAAKGEIANAINYFSKQKNVDVLIVGRGGGSLEDLWAFNEEVVARAIADCAVPVISAVGHEVDFTISDFVADLRAPTPSAAAELCVPDTLALRAGIQNLKARTLAAQKRQLETARQHFTYIYKRLPTPQRIWETWMQTLGYLQDRLAQAFKAHFQAQTVAFQKLELKLKLLSPHEVLKRGYLISKDPRGNVVSRKKAAEDAKTLTLVYQDGEVEVVTTSSS